MRKFILPAVLAAACAFLPSQAHASWLSEALHQARGDYNYGSGYYGYPTYDYSPGYSPYYSGQSYYTPEFSYSYDYAPPVYNYSPSYYVAPTYPYGYGYSHYGRYRGYNNEGREHHGDWHGNRGNYHGSQGHGDHHSRRR